MVFVLTPETFFQGRLTGWGLVQSPFGRMLRRFTIEMQGAWSEEHRALHLDETYHYIEGRSHQRQWAIHTDDLGHILGHDALEMARLRGRQMGEDFEIVFDRLRRSGASPIQPVQVVRFIAVSPEKAMMVGRIKQLGVVIATLQATLVRAG
jgi:hypothetical protein